jgi:hypothetical protein
LPLESVPNFSEGRDASTIDAIGAALGAHADLLDVHSDADHHRSVFTLVGDDISLVEALLAGIACARERIDLRDHEGAHPRIGAADVVPIVALDPADRERAKDCALRLADRIGSELGLPVFLYGESSPGRGPAFYRRGGPAELQRRMDAGEVSPDFGPGTLDAEAGGVIRACCHVRFCLKQRLWAVAGLTTDSAESKSIIPCLEPCALLLEFARIAARHKQTGELELRLNAEEAQTLSASVKASLEKPEGEIREADFDSPENPRRIQIVAEKIEASICSQTDKS